MKQKLVWILLSFLIVMGASILAYKFLLAVLLDFASESSIQNLPPIEPSNESLVKFFIQCFGILFTMGCLPFVFSAFAMKWKISKHNYWKPILILELMGLLLAYLTTPPDLISTILVFVVWQLPVLINLISLKLLVKKIY